MGWDNNWGNTPDTITTHQAFVKLKHLVLVIPPNNTLGNLKYLSINKNKVELTVQIHQRLLISEYLYWVTSFRFNPWSHSKGNSRTEQCQVCAQIFRTGWNLKLHIKGKHLLRTFWTRWSIYYFFLVFYIFVYSSNLPLSFELPLECDHGLNFWN